MARYHVTLYPQVMVWTGIWDSDFPLDRLVWELTFPSSAGLTRSSLPPPMLVEKVEVIRY
jgi:hypothetical protein